MVNHTKSTSHLNKAVKYWARSLNIFIRCYLWQHSTEGGEIVILVGCVSKFETANTFFSVATPLNMAELCPNYRAIILIYKFDIQLYSNSLLNIYFLPFNARVSELVAVLWVLVELHNKAGLHFY
jgi:hypothetical protein